MNIKRKKKKKKKKRREPEQDGVLGRYKEEEESNVIGYLDKSFRGVGEVLNEMGQWRAFR